ncbi:MAG: hypothetical protein FJX62_10520 [Alphaproteobacteria bacterium]|nr:hypothetical protein [Alphaproteobacteria bacterium]
MSVFRNRAIAAAAAAAIALTSVSFTPAVAAPVNKQGPAVSQSGDMEFSSRRRGNSHANRAVLGAVLGVFGTIAAVAAADAARDRYYRGYPHYYGPPPPLPHYYGHRYYYYR